MVKGTVELSTVLGVFDQKIVFSLGHLDAFSGAAEQVRSIIEFFLETLCDSIIQASEFCQDRFDSDIVRDNLGVHLKKWDSSSLLL